MSVRLILVCEPDDPAAGAWPGCQWKVEVEFNPPQLDMNEKLTKFEYLRQLLAPYAPSGWHIVQIDWQPMQTLEHYSSMSGVRTMKKSVVVAREPLDFTNYKGPISNEQLVALIEEPPRDRTVRLDLDDAKEVAAPKIVGRAIDI
jgi:hypothetical protein